MMGIDDIRQAVLAETIEDDGFLALLRNNRVDEARFNALVDAIAAVTHISRGAQVVDRCVVAALFEVAWEVENTVDHYAKQNPELGKRVSKMADDLRVCVNDFLWDGLESYYQG